MISGIRSLEAPSEQLIIGWTGDIQNIHQPDATVPLSNVSEEDRLALEKSLETYQPREADPDDERKTTYIPVWIGEKEAHGHYEGYCKESTFFVQPPTPRFSPSVDRRSSPDLTNSIVALVPLPLVAGRRD
jgi:hypothetical protein